MSYIDSAEADTLKQSNGNNPEFGIPVIPAKVIFPLFFYVLLKEEQIIGSDPDCCPTSIKNMRNHQSVVFSPPFFADRFEFSA